MSSLGNRYQVAIDWQSVSGWPMPAGILAATDNTALDVIRQPTSSVGAVIQSNQDSTVRIEPQYRIPTSDWATCEVDFTITDADIFSFDVDQDIRDGFNLFRITSQGTSGENYRLDDEQITPRIREFHGYITPWHDRPIKLSHSGGSWISIDSQGIVEKIIEEELVEIIGGIGKCQFPMYSISKTEYSETDLGTIEFTEDGSITTVIAGETLILITYATKYYKWLTTDANDESVQFFMEEV